MKLHLIRPKVKIAEKCCIQCGGTFPIGRFALSQKGYYANDCRKCSMTKARLSKERRDREEREAKALAVARDYSGAGYLPGCLFFAGDCIA